MLPRNILIVPCRKIGMLVEGFFVPVSQTHEHDITDDNVRAALAYVAELVAPKAFHPFPVRIRRGR
jgi:hypothetical protein